MSYHFCLLDAGTHVNVIKFVYTSTNCWNIYINGSNFRLK